MTKNTISELPKNCKNITGQRFGKLIVLKVSDKRKNGHIVWHCICDCGEKCFVKSTNLRSGDTKSCGCLYRENLKSGLNSKKHGLSYHPLYYVWKSMNARCYKPGSKGYKNYGKRGITVYDEWRNSPIVFIKWALSNGYKKGLTIERINNNRNYCPENCCFATYHEQNLNCRPISCGPMKQFWFRAWHKKSMCQHLSNNQHRLAKQHELCCGPISLCLSDKQKTHNGWTFKRI